MRRKRSVYARTLAQSQAFDPKFAGSTSPEYSYQLTFEKAHGIAGLEGREVAVIMTGSELASAIGAIPALSIEDPEDIKALRRIQTLLRNTGPRRD
jgi:hypothetical protein